MTFFTAATILSAIGLTRASCVGAAETGMAARTRNERVSLSRHWPRQAEWKVV
jgi:hypothetical protein